MTGTSFAKMRKTNPRRNYEMNLVVRQRGCRFDMPSTNLNAPAIPPSARHQFSSTPIRIPSTPIMSQVKTHAL